MLTISREFVVKPFAKVNVWKEATSIRVRAYILIEQSFEKAMSGIAIDGSGTMKPWFGAQGGKAQNKVAPIVQSMCSYIAGFDFRGVTDVIYWATGASGQDIEVIGRLTSADAERHPFSGPTNYGMDTYLQPAVNYFLSQQLSEAEQMIYIFITDGRITDMDAVKKQTTQLARAIQDGKHKPVKLLLIGVGSRVDEEHLSQLDNLDTGTDQDLWDSKIAAKMEQLAEIFTEMVGKNLIVAERGLIRASDGSEVQDYRDSGLPALLEFQLPLGSTAFTLELEDMTVTQPLAV